MRLPTRYVMLTVMVALELSGKSSTRKPLGSVYSRMPSTSATFLRLAGLVSAFHPFAGASLGGMGRASFAEAVTAKSKEARATAKRRDRVMGRGCGEGRPIIANAGARAPIRVPLRQRTSGRREMRT